MKKITLLENHSDYHLGFEVQSPEPVFISWDMTYDEVIALPCVEWDSPFDLDYEVYEYYYFKYPVRVGNLLFSKFEFQIHNTQRSDIAVQEYRFLSEKGTPEADFWQICQQLQQDLPSQEADKYLQNLYYSTHKEQISFRMQYYGEAQHRDLFFTVHNSREYPEKINPHDDEAAIEITDFIVFPKDTIVINTDYRTSTIAKRRPPLLTEKFGDQVVLWRDETNKQIGVSAGEFCNIFPLSDIEKVYIERMLPAKGGGVDTIIIQYKNEKYPTQILEAKNHLFDNDNADLEKIFKQKVLFGGAYYNC